MKDIHNEIMNITISERKIDEAIKDAETLGNNLLERLRIIYKLGHRDARHAAAELAKREGK